MTYLGSKAYRDTNDGTWFVTALCTVLRDNAHTEHLMDMMLKVSKRITVSMRLRNALEVL